MSNTFNDWNQRIIGTFRANAGEVPQFGRSLVLVHHTGAKSGLERVSPVMALRDGDDTWLIAASKAGAPENPAWVRARAAYLSRIRSRFSSREGREWSSMRRSVPRGPASNSAPDDNVGCQSKTTALSRSPMRTLSPATAPAL